MDPCYEKPVPVKIHHGHASDHAAQQRQHSNLSQEYMPFPSEKCLLMKMTGPKALNPEVEYIQGQHYNRKLNDRMNHKHARPHWSQGSQGFPVKGSHKNRFAILSVEAPVWQGAKAQEYQDIPSFCNAAIRDASALKM